MFLTGPRRLGAAVLDRGLNSSRSRPFRSVTVAARHARAMPDPDERCCEELTRREAKNFYWGFIALPRPQRVAIYALYSFARQVDDAVDLVDGELREEGVLLDRLALHRHRLRECFAGSAQDPVTRVLASAVRQYGIPREELEALLDGVEMDLRLTRYESWDELHTYCRHVASSVGRMCVRVFGYNDQAALEFADDLGAAMQLANILRDVREDARLGRIYLPLDEMRRFGVSEQTLVTGEATDGWCSLIRHEIARTEALFGSGLRVSNCIPRRSAVCVFTMAGIYQAIVKEIAKDPYLPLKRRVSLGGKEKLTVMFKSWLQAV
jgi:15-cis-phytoene synthase